MKNIFKTVNTKIFLLFLITFLSNLSYGQRTYQQRLNDLFPGVYFASNPNYNHNGSRTEGVGITEYQEYDQYGDVYYYAVDWDTEALKIPTQNDYDAIYFAILNQQLNDASYQSMMANLDSGFYLQALADGQARGELAEQRMFAYMQNSFNELFIDTQSSEGAIKTLNAFFTAVAKDSLGKSSFNYSLLMNSLGDGLVRSGSTSFAGGVFTSEGKYIDYKSYTSQITNYYSSLSDQELTNLLKGTVLLEEVFIYINKGGGIVDEAKFLADAEARYNERYGQDVSGINWGDLTQNIVNGVYDGVGQSLSNTWNFIIDDAWKKQTWVNTWNLYTEFADCYSGTNTMYSTPMMDALAKSFEKNVINGDAYTRSKALSQFGTDILTAYLGSKGLGSLNAFVTKVVETPWGFAKQSLTINSLKFAVEAKEGATLYRIGTTGKSAQGTTAQFWSLENPILDPEGYSIKYNVPLENIKNADFIETANLKSNANFITREAGSAPGSTNIGKGVEVVVEQGGTTNNIITPINK